MGSHRVYTMINTYQTSLAPPPVPPRLSRSQPVLIPAPYPSPGPKRSLTSFLVCALVLHLFLTIGGFIYLYHNDKVLEFQLPSTHPKTAYLSSQKQDSSYRAMARMVVKDLTNSSDPQSEPYLQWNIPHSVIRNVGYYKEHWLTIEQSGDYYVYSRVTFSRSDDKQSLVSRVVLRQDATQPREVVMQAYCSLDRGRAGAAASIPRLCTATQGEVMTLEEGNQLGVLVTDLSMVNYEDGATTFGMYKL